MHFELIYQFNWSLDYKGTQESLLHYFSMTNSLALVWELRETEYGFD